MLRGITDRLSQISKHAGGFSKLLPQQKSNAIGNVYTHAIGNVYTHTQKKNINITLETDLKCYACVSLFKFLVQKQVKTDKVSFNAQLL